MWRLASRPSKTTRAGLSWLLNNLVYPRERAFLEQALFVQASGRLRELADKDLSWERVVDMADRGAVLAMVAHTLAAAGSDERVEPKARATLREAYEQNAARNAMLIHTALQVQDTLRAAGIESTVIKGAALVAAFEALRARHQVDVDILVHPRDLDRAESELSRAGFIRGYRGLRVPNQRVHRFHRGMTAPSGIIVEIHFGMPDARADPQTALEAVLARSRQVDWGRHSMRIAGDTDLLGIACEHVLGRHAASQLFVPRLVSDVHVLSSAGDIDWNVVWAQYDHRHSVTDALALVDHLRSGRPFASRLRVALIAERLFVPASIGSASDLWSLAETVLKEGAGTTARTFFPRRSYLATRYDVEPSSPHLPWLYLHRLLAPAARVALVEPAWNSIALRLLGRGQR